MGDTVLLHPTAPPLTVRLLEPGRDQVLCDTASGPAGQSWGQHVRPLGPGRCRLLMRSHWVLPRSWLGRLGMLLLLEPAHFLMDERMLRGVRERAERALLPRTSRSA